MDLLRVLGILLVFNSHCDVLYPNDAMATGGSAGNAIFFIASGFFLGFREPDFGSWMRKRLIRIYPSVIIAVLLSNLYDHWVPASFGGWVAELLWPTKFWFIGGLMVFYVLMYALHALGRDGSLRAVTLVTAVLYALYYILLVDKSVWSVERGELYTTAGFFRLICYFYIFYLGYYLRRHPDGRRPRARVSALLACLCFLASYGLRFLFARGILSMAWQFLTQIFIVLFAVFILWFFLELEPRYRRSAPRLRRFVKKLGSVSLEMYLLQFMVIFSRPIRRIVFPLNIAVALVVSFLASFVYQKLIARLTAAVFSTGRRGERG